MQFNAANTHNHTPPSIILPNGRTPAMFLDVCARRGLQRLKPFPLKRYPPGFTVSDVATQVLREDAEKVVRVDASQALDSTEFTPLTVESMDITVANLKAQNLTCLCLIHKSDVVTSTAANAAHL